jgi:Mg2+ and Co2+ transporter CorA
MVSGLLSLFLLPIVLAPLALITGFVGMGATERRKHDTGNCTIGMVAAGIAVVIFLVRLHDATGI